MPCGACLAGKSSMRLDAIAQDTRFGWQRWGTERNMTRPTRGTIFVVEGFLLPFLGVLTRVLLLIR